MARWVLGIVCGIGAFVVMFGLTVSAGVDRDRDLPTSEVLKKLAAAANNMKGRLVGFNTKVRQAIDGGAEVRYSYRTTKGASLFTIKVDKAVCRRFA